MNPPLCCTAVESPEIGASSPEVSNSLARSTAATSLHLSDESDSVSGRPQTTIAGVLYKWTSYRKGWRSRWFLLRSGVVTYSKIRPSDCLNQIPPNCDVRLIGDISVRKLSKLDGGSCSRKRQKTVRVVQLKISSFKESKSDERRFYIFTATKTLQLRTASRADRVAWIQALVSSRNLFLSRSVKGSDFSLPDAAASTEKLKKRLIEAGIGENVVKDCEQIMLAEFSEIRGQLEVLFVEKSNLLGTLRQLKASKLEAEASGVLSRDCSLSRHEFIGIGHGKYSESSTSTATPSDDVEKQESEGTSDEDEIYFFDTKDYFSEPTVELGDIARGIRDVNQQTAISGQCSNVEKMYTDKGAAAIDVKNLGFERRKKLPDPVEKEKGISLWSLIKDNVGKDLTRVCLPVYFNEPISSLQKCFEDFEYSNLLDQAYEYGKAGNSLLRALKVAAFAVSGYSSTKGRPCKPFNPLLGETYEANFPEKGVRFFSEKVSHHPTVIACHCEGNGWKLWADSNLRTKFWGQSIQLDPVGVLTLEFDDGEIFQWNKVTTTLNNLILGKVYVDHHGTMHIKGNREFSCKIKFKEPFIFERNPHQIRGLVEDSTGRKVATLFGKWDESVYYVINEEGGTNKTKDLSSSTDDASLLWKSSKPPSEPTRYNLTSFAITLNELTPGLQEMLPPTDSRLRPDQRHLENGEYEKANAEKQRLEKRQRMSSKLQESGWKARWFEKEGGNGAFRYGGGYWEAREQGRWEGCPNIFGEFSEEEEEASLVVSSTNQ